MTAGLRAITYFVGSRGRVFKPGDLVPGEVLDTITRPGLVEGHPPAPDQSDTPPAGSVPPPAPNGSIDGTGADDGTGGPPAPPAIEVPDGPIPAVMAWIHAAEDQPGRVARAQAALDAENAKGDEARSTLVADLRAVLEA